MPIDEIIEKPFQSACYAEYWKWASVGSIPGCTVLKTYAAKPTDSCWSRSKESISDGRLTDGHPCVHSALNVKGHVCGKQRLARLMRAHRIVARHKRKFRATPNAQHPHPVVPNLLKRQFAVAAPYCWWVSDITYIPSQEGWLYLAVTLDLFHRKVLGWGLDRWMMQQLVMDAFAMAMKKGRP